MIEKEKSSIEDRMASLDEARLAAAAEPAIDPDLPIIDPHHHLWAFPKHRYLPAPTNSGHNLEHTVLIGCADLHRPQAGKPTPVVGQVRSVHGITAIAQNVDRGLR